MPSPITDRTAPVRSTSSATGPLPTLSLTARQPPSRSRRASASTCSREPASNPLTGTAPSKQASSAADLSSIRRDKLTRAVSSPNRTEGDIAAAGSNPTEGPRSSPCGSNRAPRRRPAHAINSVSASSMLSRLNPGSGATSPQPDAPEPESIRTSTPVRS